MKSKGLEMGKKSKGRKNRRKEILEDFTLSAVQKRVFDYYNTIFNYSDHVYTLFILYRVDNFLFEQGRKSKTKGEGEEIKGRLT